MRIDVIDLRLLRLPLVRPFETSFGRSVDRSFILVRVAGDGAIGWGECVADADPYYSSETTATAWHILRDELAPRVLGARFAHPREVYPALRIVRGHQMAKAAVEMAAWDLHARQAGVPLARALGGTRAAIASGVSIGIQESLDALEALVAAELADGYRRIKIKVKPGWDVAPMERLRARFGDIALMADANAAYTIGDAAHLERWDRFGLTMIEQPLDYDDIHDHARLQAGLATAICLDESITSVHRAEEALASAACRVINVKPGRMGGFRESIRLHDLCAARGIPVWHGGMLESGIGRAANIHLASLPNFSLPGDIAASRRYFEPDLIEPGITVRPDGTIPVPDAPGLGVEIVEERVDRATLETLTLRP